MKPSSTKLLFQVGVAGLVLAGTARAQRVDFVPNATPVTPRLNAEFTLEINVHNRGERDSTSLLVVTNVLPVGWTLVSASVATWRQTVVGDYMWYVYDPATNPVVTQVGRAVIFHPHPVPAGWWRPISMVLRSATLGLYTNAVSIFSGATTPDANPADNTLVHTLEVRPPLLSVMGGQAIPEQSGGSSAFVVRLGSSNSAPVTVDFETLDGTARAGEDFQAVSGQLTFPPGVLERAVLVPVLDDALAERAAELFSLRLTNAVNADLSVAVESNEILDNEPFAVVSVSEAEPVLEGDGGGARALFNVSLSIPASEPVLVDFTSSAALGTNGTLAIPAGATNAGLVLHIPGNVSVESNRTYQITLANPRPLAGLSLGQATASVTVLDDDGLPGKFHHLEISAVPSPQLAGRSFLLTVSAKDYFDDPATHSLDGIGLAPYVRVGRNSQQLPPVDVTNFVDGVAHVSLTVTNPATNVWVTVWRYWNDWQIQSYASTPSFRVNPPSQLLVSGPAAATEGAALLPGAGRVSIPNVDVQDVVVQLSPSDPQELALPPEVMIPAGQTSAVFNVTVLDDSRLDGSQAASIRATSPGYLDGMASVTVHDNESAALTVSVESSFREGSGIFSGTVTASSPVAVNTWVYLTSSDTSELTVGCCVVIPAGEISTRFFFDLPNDTLLDGPQSVTVTAHVENWVDGTAPVSVLDNDTNLVVVLSQDNKQPIEGLGTRTNALWLQLPGTAVEDVTVQLASSDVSEVIVPPFVIVPAGRQSVAIPTTFPDDDEFDGTQTAVITAMAPGLTTGSLTISVPDNDVHHLAFGTIAPVQTSGVPFRVSLTVKDVNDATLFSFAGSIALSTRGSTISSATIPSVLSNFVRGTWSGNVSVAGWGTNLQLVATADGGVTSSSSPFSIPTPPWVAGLRIGGLQRAGTEVQVFFDTVTGRLYQVETTTNLIGVVWTSLGPSVPGTGGAVSFVHSNPPASQRFYRLRVEP
jgi:uncharacterized repeat protein (TIGR01451 family)